MLKKLLVCAALLATTTAFARSHDWDDDYGHGRHNDVVMTKYTLKKVKFRDGDDDKHKLKCEDHGRMFRLEMRHEKTEIAACGEDKKHADWLILHYDDNRHGPYDLLGRHCKVKSGKGWRCNGWERIGRVEFSVKNEEHVREWDDRFVVDR